MKNSRSPALVHQSGRVGNKPLWFLVAPFLDFITVGNSIMPAGIGESPPTDFSIQQQQSPMRKRLQLWISVCSGKCQLADPEEKIRTEEFGNFCPKIYQLFSEPRSRELFMFVTTFKFLLAVTCRLWNVLGLIYINQKVVSFFLLDVYVALKSKLMTSL